MPNFILFLISLYCGSTSAFRKTTGHDLEADSREVGGGQESLQIVLSVAGEVWGGEGWVGRAVGEGGATLLCALPSSESVANATGL